MTIKHYVSAGLAAAAIFAGATGTAQAQSLSGGVGVQTPILSGGVTVGTQPVQQPVVVEQQPQYVVQQPQPVYVQQPQPVYVVQQPQYVVQQPPPPMDIPRFRFGVDFGGGFNAFSIAPRPLGMIQFGLRTGYQLNNLFAIYYQGNFWFAFGATTSGGTSSASAGIGLSNSILAEFTLGHILHLGIGPAVDWSAVASHTSGGSGAAGLPVTFGLHGRVAATFGRVLPWRRSGFSLGLDIHPTFNANIAMVWGGISLGYESY